MKKTLPLLACALALQLNLLPAHGQQAQPGQVIQPGQPVVPAQPTIAQLIQEGKLVPVANFGDAKFRMTSGSLMVVRGLDANRMDKPIVFPDGSTLSTGGTVRRPDGTTMQLLDGQSLTSDGKLTVAPANPDATAPIPGVPNKEIGTGTGAPTPPGTGPAVKPAAPR